jgi:serine/threonine-protein kinase RsbW
MPSVSAKFANQVPEVARVAAMAERFGGEHGLSDDDIMAVNLVLDEIVLNVIHHAYDDSGEHQIGVTLTLEEGVLTIRVDDDGRPFDPLAAPPPDLDAPLEERQIGGLGIHIVRSTMDGVEYQRVGGRNILTMRKHLGSTS